MDPSLYMSKELNLYSQDGKKRLHVADSGGVGFSFDYKDDQTGSALPIVIPNQFVYFQGDNLPLTQALSELKQAVVDEASARGDADVALQDAITDHYDELVLSIEGVNGSVTSYVSSLSSSIGDVNQELSFTRNNLQNADFALGVRIDTEVSDRQAEITRVEQLIADEVFIRTTGDNNILQSLTDEIGARSTAIETVQLSVVNEAKLRSNADTLLQGQIISLMGGATSSTVEYKQLVTDEKKRAMDAEGLLSVAIADAKAEAVVALSAEAKARSDEDVKITASVVAEAKLAREEEGKLSARIDFVLHNTSAPALDSLS
jgi:hypothetical protein